MSKFEKVNVKIKLVKFIEIGYNNT